jgi:hypothetical protein
MRPNYYCAKQRRYINIPGDFPTAEIARSVCESSPPIDKKCCKK